MIGCAYYFGPVVVGQHIMVSMCGREKSLTSWPGSRRKERSRVHNALQGHMLNDLMLNGVPALPNELPKDFLRTKPLTHGPLGDIQNHINVANNGLYCFWLSS